MFKFPKDDPLWGDNLIVDTVAQEDLDDILYYLADVVPASPMLGNVVAPDIVARAARLRETMFCAKEVSMVYRKLGKT